MTCLNRFRSKKEEGTCLVLHIRPRFTRNDTELLLTFPHFTSYLLQLIKRLKLPPLKFLEKIMKRLCLVYFARKSLEFVFGEGVELVRLYVITAVFLMHLSVFVNFMMIPTFTG